MIKLLSVLVIDPWQFTLILCISFLKIESHSQSLIHCSELNLVGLIFHVKYHVIGILYLSLISYLVMQLFQFTLTYQ